MLQLTCHPPTQRPSCKRPGAGPPANGISVVNEETKALARKGNSVPHPEADEKCDELGGIRLDPAFAVSPAVCRHNLPNPLLGAVSWGRSLLQPLGQLAGFT